MGQATKTTIERSGFVQYTRGGGTDLELPFEKSVVVPIFENKEPEAHAWADARFWVDIMAEHAVFFSLLMPPETCKAERDEALRFAEKFTDLHKQIDSSPPAKSELGSFVSKVTEQVKPFIDYKARLGEAQTSGKLRSLVWTLFFDHTRHEAERFIRRMEMLLHGESEFDKTETATFWTNIMEEHARFVAHLLDPDEFDLIEQAFSAGRVFADLHKGGAGGVAAAVVHEPATVSKSLVDNPETSAILSAAESILDFKTKAVRDIEAKRIKSIIDPRLADHVRREAQKFVDEYRRAV
jgi:hypothetical protein